jgi:hypothetical protein
VTGHGLCVRLSLLERLPFPARSPLEDMHYSFTLCSQGLRLWSRYPARIPPRYPPP